MPFRLLLPKAVYDTMVAQALAEQPLECCGLLAGVIEEGIGRVLRAYPLVNALASPVEYESDARSMLEAMRDLTRRNHDVLAVYHSHPTSAPLPSRKDLQRNWIARDGLGDVVHLIISLVESPPLVRAWWLDENEYRPADWEVT